MVDDVNFISKMKKSYEMCPVVHDSQAWKNFQLNRKYNAQFSCDFLNLEFCLKEYQEFMEFNVMHDFNRIKSKEFISYAAFSKVYREADQQASMPSSKISNLVEKLLANTDQRTSVIIVSGIPCSGKGRTADYLCRQLRQENVTCACFKMPTV